jgi:type II secretory pathway pseudopilin PulG
MVEMLGVLAIIGVLSVGAIAGYQKAMNKYRLNKATNETVFVMRSLWNDIDKIRYHYTVPNNRENTSTYLNSYLTQMNNIPTGWKVKSPYLYDNLGGYYHIMLFNASQSNANTQGQILSKANREALVFDYYYDHSNPDICVNWMTNIVKPFANDISLVWTNSLGDVLFGPDVCDDSSRKCVMNASLSEIKRICSDCDSKSSCYVAVRLL